ncbi:alpha/beta hydrolase [Amycolatopsis rhabdoformis]|uniref:Alpha/beta hydrolase n=1 Tax=Amycolatopsis rhabdoformis TaxID=1448059 RepID=A0ABZ1I3M1_9PSEU|nr:alpha/beta hydrolase [Amycolatopsis rhabdoformis]WSE28069.1 alpha/beta hydrolase [Amycolatopsis rhabdoformis]
MPLIRRVLALLLIGFLAAACASSPPPAPPARASSCRVVQTPVSVPGVPAPGRLAGDLCTPAAGNGTVLLLVAGGGENADYWNLPELSSGSFVRAALAEGYATYALDRLGTGRSTVPASSKSVTYDAQVSTVDQVATALRAGSKAFGTQWHTVVGIGHSLGSGTLAGVAARDTGALDALVLTGYGAAVTPETLQLDKLYQVPARTVGDRWRGLDDGYVTVLPDKVEQIGLVHGPGTDPHALAAIGAHQGILSDTELASRPQGPAAAAQAARIKLPALVAVGQFDRHYCEGNPVGAAPSPTPQCANAGAFQAYEKKLLPNACLATNLVAGSGHAIQEELAAPTANTLYLSWLRATFSGGGARCAETGPVS